MNLCIGCAIVDARRSISYLTARWNARNANPSSTAMQPTLTTPARYIKYTIAGSAVTRLAPMDRELLRFLYTHLRPGDDAEAVRRAFEQHWGQ